MNCRKCWEGAWGRGGLRGEPEAELNPRRRMKIRDQEPFPGKQKAARGCGPCCWELCVHPKSTELLSQRCLGAEAGRWQPQAQIASLSAHLSPNPLTALVLFAAKPPCFLLRAVIPGGLAGFCVLPGGFGTSGRGSRWGLTPQHCSGEGAQGDGAPSLRTETRGGVCLRETC